jgi:molybdenum cofactor cytidylyltransferase
MAESLTTAIEHTRGAEGWLIGLGDMPHVRPDTMRALAATIQRGARIAAPVYEGRSPSVLITCRCCWRCKAIRARARF